MKNWITVSATVVFCVMITSAGPLDRVTMSYEQKIFVSGINAAWKNFGGDVGKYPLDSLWFEEMIQGVADSGGNAVRWWLFTDCSNDPLIDPVTKLTTGLGESTVANIRKVLDMGYSRGVSIDLCLLSFDMMKTGKTGVDIEANKKILQTDEGRKAFIDNAVVPLVTAIGYHPAILCWEIFNEPEGMVKSIAGDWGSMASGIEITDVQKTVNQVTGAIHRAVPGVPVSNGCWAFIAGSNTIEGDHNYYTDSALVSVGGDPDGTLDFYMVHYYEWAGTKRSPFHHPASYWGLDKPLVIAEFPAKGLSDSLGGLTPAQCWNYLMENGYAGAMGWTYTAHDGFGGLPEAGQGMRVLKTSVPSDVTLDFPPIASDDWYADTTDKTLNIAAPGVLANDRDPTPGQTLSASLITPVSHGTVALNSDGSFTYTPAAGWAGTDRFVYALRSGDASDTATAVIRMLDPSKGVFFAPPRASQWQIYAGWGTFSVADLQTGMGMNHSQWGSASTWIVGGGVPVTLTAEEQTVSVQVLNDPSSQWAVLRFHLTTQAAVGNYGPTDTTVNIIELTPKGTGKDGFTEYRGTFTPGSAGTFLPSLQFIWDDSDGNGPNYNHQSVIRDLEIFPSSDFVGSRNAGGDLRARVSGIKWKVSGQTVSITSPGEMIYVEVTDLRGRLIQKVADKDEVRWKSAKSAGMVALWVKAGSKRCSFVVPAAVK